MAESQRSASSSSTDPFGTEDRQEGSEFLSGESGDQLSLALDVGRMWVREHQKMAMLCAFAVGVFTGSWFRD